MKNTLVVIPTYNESENIIELIDILLGLNVGLNILVVDDNSPDGTSSLVESHKQFNTAVFILKRAGKLGLGTAYCEGFTYAIEKKYDFVVEMDADFSHDPHIIPKMLDVIDNADFVIGSRYSNGVNVVNWPMSRLLLSYYANMYTRIITGMPIKDTTAGFKCFRISALKKLDLSKIKSNGYGFQIEVNYKLWTSGAEVQEIPIIFVDRRNGVSKMNKSIVYEAVFLVWKLKFLHLIGKLQ